MFILIGIVIVEAILLGLTIWSARRTPLTARARLPRRRDDLPHAL